MNAKCNKTLPKNQKKSQKTVKTREKGSFIHPDLSLKTFHQDHALTHHD